MRCCHVNFRISNRRTSVTRNIQIVVVADDLIMVLVSLVSQRPDLPGQVAVTISLLRSEVLWERSNKRDRQEVQ